VGRDVRIAVYDRVVPYPFSPRLQQGILFGVEAETFVHLLISSIRTEQLYRDLRASPPRAWPLHRLQPPWLQLRIPLGVPLYPVDKIRLDRTNNAPTRRFMQFDRCDASEASVCTISL
jgi:hypothetical protein